MPSKSKQQNKTARKQSLVDRLNNLSPAKIFAINFAVLALSLFLLCAALIVQNNDSSAVPFQGFKQGVTVTMGKSAMRVNSAKTTNGTGIFTAPEGKQYLVVDLTVKNTSETPINVIPSIDTYLKAPNGKVTIMTPFKLEQPFRAGELLPGEQISGELSYLVAINSAQKFYIDAPWSGGVVPFAVR